MYPIPLLRLFFVLLLLASAAGKLADMPGFYPIVANYRLLPGVLVAPGAWALALTELTLALWLAGGRHLSAAAATLVGLHALYFVWLSVALARGLSLDNCGCFGVYLARPLSVQSLVEDGALLGAALILFFAAPRT